jgi:hypothetical protein
MEVGIRLWRIPFYNGEITFKILIQFFIFSFWEIFQISLFDLALASEIF